MLRCIALSEQAPFLGSNNIGNVWHGLFPFFKTSPLPLLGGSSAAQPAAACPCACSQLGPQPLRGTAPRRLLSASSRSPARQHTPLGRKFSRYQPPVVQDYILTMVSFWSWLHTVGWYLKWWRISRLQSHIGLLDVTFLNSKHKKCRTGEVGSPLLQQSPYNRPKFLFNLQLTRLLKYFWAFKRCLFEFVLEFQCPWKQVSEFSSYFQKRLMEFSINLSSPSATSPSTWFL